MPRNDDPISRAETQPEEELDRGLDEEADALDADEPEEGVAHRLAPEAVREEEEEELAEEDLMAKRVVDDLKEGPDA